MAGPETEQTAATTALSEWNSTQLAEDRTILALERTFAGWLRTGMASLGIGIGFLALFQELHPNWLPRALATLFILLGIFIFWSAERRASEAIERLHTHSIQRVSRRYLRAIALSVSIGAVILIAGLWSLTAQP
ncbi:hypothetical protein GCM10023219_00310 [Stakelama sediminis]|uniref:Putative membrane protein n=1 Tax=Stakelama sediminis TaxID=463200 RepID=A0A840Z1G7_9SPHN|nr:DUF202 domain-containing protein [Stakelama sediminis]MBB5719532.1 putative membrane protein [Stakelama sediminis]